MTSDPTYPLGDAAANVEIMPSAGLRAPAPSITRASCVPECEAVPVIKGSHVYLIDGSGFIFRAFHALPPLTRPSDGLPVGAVHGFCAMLWKLIGDSKLSDKPTHIAVIFDAGRETFRNAIYSDYKAHRPPPPDELIPQFALIRDAVTAFNIACIEQDGYEADDIIATYARDVVAAGGDATIVSSDKDLMQLIAPGITMLDGMKNKRFGPDEVFEKFGVAPNRVIDVQALAGDSIDNVPGVPGIGIKTAAELIHAYGDLDTLLERAHEIKQNKRREKLIEFAEQARISRQLVTLKCDVPVEFPLDRLGLCEPDSATLLGFLQRMEFSTLTQRIAGALGAQPPSRSSVASGASTTASAVASSRGSTSGVETPAAGVAWHKAQIKSVAFDRTAYVTITDETMLAQWCAVAREAGRFVIDVQTGGPDAMSADILGLGLAVTPGLACYVPLVHQATPGSFDFGAADANASLAPSTVWAHVRPLLEDASVLKIGHNIKVDVLSLAARQGITVAPVDDIMLMSYALDGGRWDHGLDGLTQRHLDHTCLTVATAIEPVPGAKRADRTFAALPLDRATHLAGEVADAALRLWHVLKPRLAAERQTTVYETLERPLVPVVVAMERAGIRADRAILARLSSQFAQTLARLESEVDGLVGVKFNLGSPKQLGELLFDTLKLPGGKRTKSGQWETRAGLLDEMAANEELPPDARKLLDTMLAWRQLTKLRSTYTDSLPTYMDAHDRIHTSYAFASTTTGRLSSNDPNLQNIPIRTKEGREIRTAFIAEPGHKLISADYSQIELRVLAHMAHIPQLTRAFAEGVDIHTMTASEMFNVAIADMTADVRRRAKAINFGIIYGISAFGLAAQLSISREEAGDYIKTYFARFPGIRDYMEDTKRFAHDNGYVETIFGRRIHYPEINTRNPGVRGNLERAAINAPIQGSAADIIRRAMIRMPDALSAAGFTSARMLLQVHDELVFEARDGDVEGTLAIAARVMEAAPLPAVAMAVPIKVDAKAALNWEAAH